MMDKKTYIQPELKKKKYVFALMQATSLPQGGGGSGKIDDEDDELSKSREKGFEGWGDLW